jgi:PTS system nitrogen regulatory IIA component
MKASDLVPYFKDSLFISELKAKDKDGVLNELVDHLAESGEVKDRTVLLEMLRNRENLGTTGLGKGVAFPHGRSLAVRELTILFARSPAGVDYDSVDGKPAHLFFLILAPPVDENNLYHQVLSRIIQTIQNDEKRDRLLKTERFTDLVEVMGSESA